MKKRDRSRDEFPPVVPLEDRIAALEQKLASPEEEDESDDEEGITGQIFLGNGWRSLAKVGYVYQLLGQAFDTIAELQQPPRPNGEDCSQEDWEEIVENGERRLRDIASNITMALTGKKWRPVETDAPQNNSIKGKRK